MSARLLSIIVPTLNVVSTLSRCLQSVERQHFRNFEVIVVDEVSSDRTTELALQWMQLLPRLVLDSQRDNGIYQAINRGVQLARGRWILMCGADDRLAGSTALADVAPTLCSTDARLIYGDVRIASRFH